MQLRFTTVGRWAKQFEEGGLRALKRAGRAGRKARLRAEDLRRIERGLERGPQALGYESGLSQRPHRCRTWAPRGQTPVLEYHFNWRTLSAMAGVTWWNFYFRLYPGTIRGPQMIDFLRHLLCYLRGKLLIV